MKKYLIIYASDIDLEAIQDINGFSELKDYFDGTEYINGDEEKLNQLPLQLGLKLKAIITNNKTPLYLQIIAHGNSEGVAIRKIINKNRVGAKETLVSYDKLSEIFNSHTSLSLNLMTVCKSAESNFDKLSLDFLGVSVDDSIDSSIKHSERVLANNFGKETLNELSNEYGYRFKCGGPAK